MQSCLRCVREDASGVLQPERTIRWLGRTLEDLNIPHTAPALPAETAT